MNTSQYWLNHFQENLKKERINWSLQPNITEAEKAIIVKSLQAWQLGETSEGKQLMRASERYATQISDTLYPKVVELFIQEEQKHGRNLGEYLTQIGEKTIQKDWGDSLFRNVRSFNTNMESWTLAVLTVESVAQVYYQALKDATKCTFLKQICTDILIDEAYHIEFQTQRMTAIYQSKSPFFKFIRDTFYKGFYFATILLIWFAHKQVFKAGGNNFQKYFRKMSWKYKKTFGRVIQATKQASIKQSVVQIKHEF